MTRWATNVRAVVRDMAPAVRRATIDDSRNLLASGLRHAPVHTGALRRSLRVAARRVGQDGVELALQSDDPAAGAQETGGIISRRSRPMLVPIGSENAFWKSSGTRREASSIPGLFRIRANSGRIFLATRNANRSLLLRFELRSSVRMPPQFWASHALENAGPPVIANIRARLDLTLLATRVSQ